MPSGKRKSSHLDWKRNGTLLVAAFLVLLLGGCGSVSYSLREVPTPQTPQTDRFETLPGRGADVVAALRAEPAPSAPDFAEGKQFAADGRALAARGYMMIGTAHFASGNTAMRSDAVRIGAAAGADQVLLYPPEDTTSPAAGAAADGTPPARWLAAYYVRVKPPFGATFRDLSDSEREQLGVPGGVRIGSVIGGSPASEANLLHGDVILRIDRHAIANKSAFEDLLKRRLGKHVTLTIRRGDNTLERMVRLGMLPSGPS
ncbi:MAG: PDZ domain-containing protein [Rhodanobacteraceae bacterium]